MKAVIMKELKIMIKQKGNFFWLILMPILFIVLFGSIFGNQNSTIIVHVIDQDHSTASKGFLEQIGHIKGMEIKQETSGTADDQIQKIKNGQLSSLVVIPEGFGQALQAGQQAKINLYRDEASPAEVAPIEAMLRNMINGYREQKLTQVLSALNQPSAAVAQELQPPIQIHQLNTSTTKIDAFSQIVPGYTVMFAFYIIITMLRRFFKEKESGMLSRVQSTSVNSFQYLVGMWVPAWIAVLIQCTVLLGFGHFVYDLQLGDLIALSLIVLCLSICATGLGLAISIMVKGENQGMAVTQLLVLGGAAISGLWVPFYLLPSFAQSIGRLTPQYWAQKGMTDVISHHAHLSNILPSLGVLLAFGVVGLFIASLRFPSFIRSANS